MVFVQIFIENAYDPKQSVFKLGWILRRSEIWAFEKKKKKKKKTN